VDPVAAVKEAVPVSVGGPRGDRYDVVVIGAGVGGLTAGALLARAGLSVLVVEAEQRPGGHARALRDGRYTFDPAVHLINACEPDGPFGPGIMDAVLRHLDVRDRCDFVRIDDPVFEARFPDFRLGMPHGREAYLEALTRRFPAEGEGIGKLVELSAGMLSEWLSFPMQPRMIDVLMAPWRAPMLFRYRNATINDVIDRELHDPRARSVYAALSRWLTLPLTRASFANWAIMIGAYIQQGAYYCRGSFRGVADALAEALERAGGELLLGSRATRIIAPDGKVQAVELDARQRIGARRVISNIDPRETFGRLLEPQQLPKRYLRRLQRGALSDDFASLYLATDLDVRALGAPFDTSLYTEWNLDQSYARNKAGEVTYIDVMIPTLADPSLAPPGEHIVIVQTVPFSPTADSSADARVAERMLELAEQVIPGLRDHITHTAPAATDGDHRGALHRTRTIYGWEMSPRYSGVKRLPPRTPVDGLLLCGQWTQPGVGVTTVAASGVQAARLALGAPAARPPLPIGLPTGMPQALNR
jgi:phytoene dehydrogenase-like protein